MTEAKQDRARGLRGSFRSKNRAKGRNVKRYEELSHPRGSYLRAIALALSPICCVLGGTLGVAYWLSSPAQVDWRISTMDRLDTVEIRVHPSNFQRVIRDAQERGAKVSRSADGRYLIDEIPVILDSRLDVADKYAISYGGGKFWDC